MSLTHALLGVLESRPMNGYELTKFFDSAARWIWSAPQSQIYTTLRKMQSDGLIDGATQTRVTRMKSLVYSITEEGRNELVDWVRSVHELPAPRDALFLQALFFDLVDETAARAVLESSISENEKMIELLTTQRELLLAKATPLIKERLAQRPKSQHDRIVRLKAQVFKGEIDRATSSIQWARQTLDLLRE